MEKKQILEKLIENLMLSNQDYIKLQDGLYDYAEKNSELSEAELVKAIERDFPQLKLLHENSMRKYAKIKADNSRVIKTILIILFFYIFLMLRHIIKL